MRLRKRHVVACLSAALVLTPQASHQAFAGKTRDAILGGLIGAAIVAAASKHHRHQQKLYYDGYQPYPPDRYDPYWNDSYSPAFGITCYRAQAACYKLNGHYSAKWTRMQFADGE